MARIEKRNFNPENTPDIKGSGEIIWDILTKEKINIAAKTVKLIERFVDCSNQISANLAAYPFCK